MKIKKYFRRMTFYLKYFNDYLYEYRDSKMVKEYLETLYGKEDAEKFFDDEIKTESNLIDCERENLPIKRSVNRFKWRKNWIKK